MEQITDDELIRMSRLSREALVSGSAIGLNLGNFAYPLTEILFGQLACLVVSGLPDGEHRAFRE